MSAEMPRILVTGATGKQGGATLRHLRALGFPLRALTRDPAKPAARYLASQGADVVAGDMSDKESLTRALDGVQGLYAVQTPFEQGTEAEVAQGRQLIDAARQQGVGHVVYSSVAAADQNSGIPHFESKAQVEEHLRASGLAYTILRPVYFMENWLNLKEMLDQGFLAWPSRPDTHLQQIAVDDIGFFAANAFQHPEQWKNRAVEIAGDELTYEESMATFSQVLGRPIAYRQIPWDVFEQRLGRELTIMFRWFEDHNLSADIQSLRKIHPGLLTLRDWLKDWPK